MRCLAEDMHRIVLRNIEGMIEPFLFSTIVPVSVYRHCDRLI
jgi:hypothetical protein